MKNIRSKILLLIVVMFALMGIIVLFFSSTIYDKYKEMQMNECRMLIDYEAEGINKKIRELRENAKSIALCGSIYYNSPVRVKELGEKSLKAHFETGAVAVGGGFWFEPYKLFPGSKRACFYAFNNGKEVILDEGFLSDEYNYHNQIWYVTIKAQVKKNGDVAWSPPYYDAEGTKSLMTTAGAGIFDKNGNFVGMSTVDWKLDAIAAEVARILPTKNSFSLFADERSDYIMALNDKSISGDPVGKSLKTLEWFNGNFEPETHFSYKNARYISISRHLDNGMLIAVNIPETELFADINSSAKKTIFALTILSLLIAVLAYNGLDILISKPISYLSQKAKEIGDGNFDVNILLDRNDELGDFAKTFAVMAKDIKLHSQQMKSLNESLQNALAAKNSDDFISDITAFIGRNLSAQRCCFIRCDSHHKPVSISEWVSSPIYSNAGRSQEIISFDLGKWFEKFNRGEAVISENVHADTSPEFAGINLIPSFADMKSFIAIGVESNGKVLDLITVEFLSDLCKITDREENLIRSSGRILEIVIERFSNIAKVEESEYMRSLVLDSIDIPIMLFDSNRKLLNANTAVTTLVERSLDEILSQPCNVAVCKGMFDENNCPVQECIRTGKVVTNEIRTTNGREFHNTMTPVFDKEKKLKYVIESMHDMTAFNEGKRMLLKAMQDAQAADKAKSYFIATMSHELRTPLNAVIGYTELTQNPDLSQEERMHNLKNIDLAANTLLNLINDILDLSKLEAGQMTMVKSPVNMLVLANEFLHIFKFAAKKKEIDFTVRACDNFPTLMLDPLRLKQILMNVIGNAIKFTDKGVIAVEISYAERADSLVDLSISVKDTGIGMSPEFIKKIFEPFSQDGRREGTGLGLSIVKRLVENMGGEIAIESRINEGSEFTITISDVEVCFEPCEPQADISDALPSAPATISPHASASGMKVMLLDDIVLNLKVLRKMLLNLGCRVIETSSGAEALKLVKSAKPDIIMTDLWMPEMNGEEFARIVKSDPETSGIPIIVVTADTQVQDPAKVFDDVLFKPITMKTIKAKLERFV